MTEKQKREKIRAEIAKQYRDEIAELKRQVILRDRLIMRMQGDIQELKKENVKLPLHLEAARRLGGRENIDIQDIVDYCVRSNLIANWLYNESSECGDSQ